MRLIKFKSTYFIPTIGNIQLVQSRMIPADLFSCSWETNLLDIFGHWSAMSPPLSRVFGAANLFFGDFGHSGDVFEQILDPIGLTSKIINLMMTIRKQGKIYSL